MGGQEDIHFYASLCAHMADIDVSVGFIGEESDVKSDLSLLGGL